MNKREEIIAKALSIPGLSLSVQQVLKLINDPDADATKLTRAIEIDPGLTANILRMANSAFFGAPGSISTVKEAVVRIGMQRVFQMAIAADVAPRTKGEVKGYDLKPGELLEHSIAVGLAAEELAHVLGISAPSHAFTAGLLVNIGKTALGEFLEVDAAPILEKAYEELISFEKAEEEILGVSHTELGALLLESWQIPASICNVVRFRLRPEDSPVVDPALDLVHVGDIITKMTGIGMGVDGMHYTPSIVVFDRLGIKPGMLELVMETILENVSTLKQSFLGEESASV